MAVRGVPEGPARLVSAYVRAGLAVTLPSYALWLRTVCVWAAGLSQTSALQSRMAWPLIATEAFETR
ncbi:MAG: hypothetical protein RL701_5476 [Pseudomonadota bacterium]